MKTNILDEIVQNKQKEVKNTFSDMGKFKKIFQSKNASVIGEVKLKSPNNNYFEGTNDELQSLYEFYGNNTDIKAISILIDEKYFSGDIHRGKILKEKYKKPILFKEFVIDKKQVDGASYYGYDALLLIKRILKSQQLKDLIIYTLSKNIFPIVEVDNEKDFKQILTLSEKYDFGIAINSRNLQTMEINTNIHFEIFEKYKTVLQQKLIFAFSGINYSEKKLYKGKFNGILIGSYFMKQLHH